MNVNHAVNMILRLVFRQMLHRGVNAGIDAVARRGKPADEMTPDEQARARSMQQAVGRGRQALRMGRRIGRF